MSRRGRPLRRRRVLRRHHQRLPRRRVRCVEHGLSHGDQACDVAETCRLRSQLSHGRLPAELLHRRAAAGACDIAETCTGASATCPTDAFQPSSFTCRAAAGACDIAETCTGASATCPTDAKSTAVCRPVAGTCDVEERCDGIADACPSDVKQPQGTVCRPAAGACDVAESCTGASASCPSDGFADATVECRPAADGCDIAEQCPGTAAACPTDAGKQGIDGAVCVFARPLAGTECTGTIVPGNIGRFYDKAHTLVTKAATAATAKRRKLLTQATKALTRAANAVNTAQGNGLLPTDCANGLRDLLFDALQRVRAARP
ncbi:MAG: hypothetical protein U0807_12530 [Candidatus Binatia bacterium]